MKPPTTLAESVVRLRVGSDGNLNPTDFFSPADNAKLDQNDADLGSGAPVAIPDGYGTPQHPHLLAQVGKDGHVYLLDRDNLGGMAQGPGGTDAVLDEAGPYSGVWGRPAFLGTQQRRLSLHRREQRVPARVQARAGQLRAGSASPPSGRPPARSGSAPARRR